MSYVKMRELTIDSSQALYLFNNCNQDIIQCLLDTDLNVEDIPKYKFKRLSDGEPKYGVRLSGNREMYNVQGTIEYQTTPVNDTVCDHAITGAWSDYDKIVAVFQDVKYKIEVGRVVSNSFGERFVLKHTNNFALPSFDFYGKRTSDGAFVKITATISRYSTNKQKISQRQRNIDPIGNWSNPFELDFMNDGSLYFQYQDKTSGGLIGGMNGDTAINFRIAKDVYCAEKYVIDDDESGLIDDGSEPETKELYENLYFKQEYWRGVMSDPSDPNSYYCDGYYVDGNFVNAEMDADFYAHYQFNLRDKPNLCMYIGSAITPTGTHASGYYNARCNLYLLERDGVVYADETYPVFCWNMGNGGRYKNVTSAIGDGLTPIGVAPKMVISLGDIQGIEFDLFGYNMQTNIPIFRTRADAERYLAGEIGKEQAINDVGFNIPQGNLTGHELRGHNYNTVDASAVCSECLCCSSAAFSEFFDKLFNTTDRQSILEGLEMYGTDPSAFIVDTFAIPFDASTFQDLSATNTITFGTYTATLQNSVNKTSKLNPKIVHAFDIQIIGGFNDWRDYQSEYYLCLPYVGRNIHISKEKYLYKTLSCDVSVDVRTGQIKYFLKCDGVVTDTYEGVCRISMPIQTTNNYSYAREKLDACASVVGGVVGGAMNLATGNPTGILGNAVGIVNGMLDLDKCKEINTTGNCSPSNAWNDPLECYLVVQTPEFIYPTNVSSVYGLPSNIIGRVGSVSGYAEFTNVILNAPCTQEERDEILTELSNGVII